MATSVSSSPVRLLIVDDSSLVRAGLRAVLSASGPRPGVVIVGEAANVASARTECSRLRPEVVLLDIRLPDGTGLDACRQILKDLPDTKILFLTSVVDDAIIDEAIRAGAHGYLLKEIDGPGLLQAIQGARDGKSTLDPEVTARVIQMAKSGSASGPNPLAALSPQEQRVLTQIAAGLTNKEAGTVLNLSEKTVKNYLSSIFEKLHVARRSQAAALFVQHRR